MFNSIKIYGHGKQTRSFQYVTDLVDGLVALMNSSYTLPINLGNPIEHNIDGIVIKQKGKIALVIKFLLSLEFAQIIKSIVNGADSSIRYLPAVEDDPQRRRPDITRAKKYLNWEPKVLEYACIFTFYAAIKLGCIVTVGFPGYWTTKGCRIFSTRDFTIINANLSKGIPKK